MLFLAIEGLKSKRSLPSALKVFSSTKENSSGFSRLKLKGSFRATFNHAESAPGLSFGKANQLPTGGFVMTRGIRRLFLDAECSMSG